MDIRRLRKELPKGMQAERQGRDSITVRTRVGEEHVHFTVSRRAGWSEPDLAAYLQSKIPAIETRR